MSRVLPFSYQVGQYQAQVIDFNKTYNAIVQNAAAVRKQQAQAKRDIEKQIDIALADKRDIRPQDRDVVDAKRQDVYNYYYNNMENIGARGSALGELKMKMGEFTALVTESSSLARKNQQFLPVLNKALDPKNEVDPEFTSIVDAWNLPIGEERKKKTFKRDGIDTPINELDVTDFKYYEKFDEPKHLDSVITKNVKPFDVEKVTLQSNKKLGMYVDMIDKVKVFAPNELINQVASVANTRPNQFINYFDKQLATYKSLPEEDRNLEFKSVQDAYKELAGFDITSYFKKEGGPGIDNALEFAAFKNLQSHLPQVVKDSYDYRTQRALVSTWSYGLASRKFADKLKKDEENQGFDVRLVEDIKSGKFNAKEWEEYLNQWVNIGNPGAGSVRAGSYKFSNPDKFGRVNVTYMTQIPIRDEGGNLISTTTSAADAQARVSKQAGATAKQATDGVWYAQFTNTVVLDPKAADLSSNVINMNSYMENALGGIPEAQKKYNYYRGQSRRLVPR